MARRDFFILLTRQSLKNYIEPYLFLISNKSMRRIAICFCT